jgi:hypothetical protein
MSKIISTVLKVVSILCFVLALLSAGGLFFSFIERQKYGAGLMFADVEIFLFLTLFFLVTGFLLFWIGKKVKSKVSTDN